jgi:catechol 2,3-dioxygenase-like lactoylglutathione lyase family enzyme
MRISRTLVFFLVASSLFAFRGAAQQAQRPAITGIAFMRVYATDPTAAEHFYGATLGLKRIEQGDTWIYPVNSRQWVEVLPHTPPPSATQRMAAVAFMTRDAAGLERYLNAHGIATVVPMSEGEFGVRDPEGNLILFVDGREREGAAKLVAAAKPSDTAPSQRIIHVGFIVRDRAKEDPFWREVLGFTPYWHGGRTETETDWVSQQVPEGTDWLEYMLNIPEPPTLKQTGVEDHFSLGTERMQSVLARLQANGCVDTQCRAIQVGRDGKIQLNLYDPDQTRVEFMEFTPAIKSCCSPLLGRTPGPVEAK